MARIPSQLQDIAADVHGGRRRSKTVRELLSWFGAQRRGVIVVREIRIALHRVRLTTTPKFEVAYIDEKVKFEPIEPSPPLVFKKIQGDLKAAGTEAPQSPVVGGSVSDPSPRIGMLKAANTAPLSVNRDTELTEAISKMLMHDYSHLPVMQSDRAVNGLISWKSIGRARVKNGNLCKHVRDCMEEAEVISSDMHLFDAIKRIADKEVVLVRNSENRIVGLVTTNDISLQFGTLSEPFLLLSEVENHIRRLIDGKFSLDQLKGARDPSDSERKIENVANLTFGEYIRLLEKPDNWARLGLDLSRVECIKRLREVGRIRNDVMHFHPDGISPEDMDLLRDTRKFLQAL